MLPVLLTATAGVAGIDLVVIEPKDLVLVAEVFNSSQKDRDTCLVLPFFRGLLMRMVIFIGIYLLKMVLLLEKARTFRGGGAFCAVNIV